MTVLIIDGQGGKLGRQLVKSVSEQFPQIRILAVGTNSAATANMLKGGAQQGATGENAVIVACRKADVILGPLGIVVADALLGEVTPAMAAAVGQSRAARILIPINRCDNLVDGISNTALSHLLEDAMDKLRAQLDGTLPTD